jgi:hypothetical protein
MEKLMKNGKAITALTTLALIGGVSLSTNPARAQIDLGPLTQILKPLVHLSIPVHIQFRNESGTMIHVVMDGNREAADIPPQGAHSFSPNVGDNPTFHVVNPMTGKEQYARAIGIQSHDGSVGWDGSKF